MLDGIPSITVCLWRERSDATWRWGTPATGFVVDEDGGADWLFKELDGRPETYARFAADYFEVHLETADIGPVFDHRPLDADLVSRLNPEADTASVLEEARSMDYPVSEWAG